MFSSLASNHVQKQESTTIYNYQLGVDKNMQRYIQVYKNMNSISSSNSMNKVK